MAEGEEELKSFLMKVKEESEKAGLKLNIQKKKIMTSSPITSWQIMGKKWKQWGTLFSWTPESMKMVTCSHDIKRRLLLGRKAMTNLDSLLKSRDITLLTRIRVVKAMIFPIVMYGCESWTIMRQSDKELMLLNCGVEDDSWESLGLQGDQTSPS